MSPAISGADLGGALFRPRRVALIGASDDPISASYRPLDFLRKSGYAGAVYPVNLKRDTVRDEPAWKRIDDLPEVPDHAFVMTPASVAAEVVRSCGALGVAVATILSGGFAESGPEGIKRQEELVEAAAESGIRLVGPNSLGLVNFKNGLLLTGNAFFNEGDFLPGGIFVASQSGSLIGSLVSRGQARGVGFSSLISVGGEADLSIGEICSATLDDDDITSYMLFLETIRHADALAAFARGAADRGKSVVACKLGRSAGAARLAVSHTGALVGEDDIASLFLAECGIARVDGFDGLIGAAPLLAKLPIASRHAPRRRVGVVTSTGGGAAMIVDQLGVRGVEIQQPSDETFQRLKAAGTGIEEGTIVDLTLAGTRPEIMKATLDILLTAPEFDMVIAVAGSSARNNPELLIPPIAEASATYERVLVTFLVPEAPEALARLTELGVPVFQSPEACADVIAAAFSRRPPQLRPLASLRSEQATTILDEMSSYQVLSEVGVPVSPTVLVDITAAGRGSDEIKLPFGYPVAVKVVSESLPHKSDIDGVILGVTDATALAAAITRLVSGVGAHRPDLKIENVLVQSMVAALGEVLIAYRIDAQVGPVVVLAAGGVLAELTQDRSVRLAPIDAEDAQAMLEEVVLLRALRGFRDRPLGDLEGLTQALVAISTLYKRPEIVEAEVNPLMVRAMGNGVVAVDAVVTAVDRDAVHG